ncbi:glutamate-5-semialdehyde dehydrogenase [Herpetosiphon geysericola]|uniref:Gamma-glutamyl phosphate reductase n=1 Tax=Herpetosiphon geysericola TaxID=70996 RepID=A0A0P6XCN2_9CHLR|nr:glutamate-5-semialdehyde dehydrogenase [Herpetosiphon geysericola]KPL80297.1 gamma-glutamyl phosphate reductase [Herpetosiphon geysericola]
MLEAMGQRAKLAARLLARTTTAQRNAAVEAMAEELSLDRESILSANAADMRLGREAGLTPALLDRLLLNEQRLEAIANDVRTVAVLPDPVGEVFEQGVLPNGLRIEKRRVPLGVVGVIYEARPNVTADVAALCIKAGSAVILRGGKEITRSAAALVQALRRALERVDLPADALQLIDNPDRELVRGLLTLDRYVDMIIPRGGSGLHAFCRQTATIPVITGGIGVCHAYVDHTAPLDQVVPIIVNAKVQRPSVCNSLETLLIERSAAAKLLPRLGAALQEHKVELRCDPESLAILREAGNSEWHLVAAQPDDFGQEFSALILAVRVVDGLDQALEHIDQYGTDHSETILSQDPMAIERFLNEVDSAVVYANSSTRFTDGSQLGLGAEIAISTQKLHARGPMALRELTSYKWIVRGAGHVRD